MLTAASLFLCFTGSKGRRGELCSHADVGRMAGVQLSVQSIHPEGCSQSSLPSSSYLGAHTTASASIFLFSVSRFITFLLGLPSYLWDNNSSLLCEGASHSFLSLSTGNGPITVVLGFQCTFQPRGRFVKPWLAASPPRILTQLFCDRAWEFVFLIGLHVRLLLLVVPGLFALLESQGMNGDTLLSLHRRRKEYLSLYHYIGDKLHSKCCATECNSLVCWHQA